jgi:putative Holliday junction resolvase
MMAGRRADGPAGGEARWMAVDWGTRRIGLALSDPTGTIAQPLATLTRRSGRRFPMQQLRTHLEHWRPAGVVVGLPLESDGSEGAAAREARAAARLIAEKSGLPVELMDERMTTARALEAGPGTDRVDLDQRAATVLLQLYLDRRRTS